MFRDIIGHEAVCTFLEKSILNKRVSHAYLFLGPRGVGKMTVARAFARAILSTDAPFHQALEIHPDVSIVGRLPDEKTGQPKSAITIEQIRELCERLARSSLLPSAKVALIDDADTMTIEAANALLKTLEEPRGKTVLFLLASDARRVPLTVRSRAVLVRFGLVPGATLLARLRERGVEHRDAGSLARLASGRPGRALDLLLDAAALREFNQKISERHALLSGPVYARLQWIESRARGAKAAALTEELYLWQEIVRDRLLRAIGCPELATFTTADQNEATPATEDTVRTIRRLRQAADALRHHVDPRLALEYFIAH
ncbi:AAA family ATPase [Candidatus Uhrbacteria bacterium]|nr:AAA family ATPase [Candidatus Uhrbacteria bacterium]